MAGTSEIDQPARAPDEPRAYALWDTLADLRFTWSFFIAAAPHLARRKRCRERIAEYQTAADSGVIPSSLAHDLGFRRSLWHRHLDDDRNTGAPSSGSRRGWADFLLLGADEWFILFAIIGVALAVSSVIVLAIPWCIWHIIRVRRRRRCFAAISAGACPDCGYDLRASPPAIPTEHLTGLNAGPERCPECGVPWPLLPPPVMRR